MDLIRSFLVASRYRYSGTAQEQEKIVVKRCDIMPVSGSVLLLARLFCFASVFIGEVNSQAIEPDAACDSRLYIDQALLSFQTDSAGFYLQVLLNISLFYHSNLIEKVIFLCFNIGSKRAVL